MRGNVPEGVEHTAGFGMQHRRAGHFGRWRHGRNIDTGEFIGLAYELDIAEGTAMMIGTELSYGLGNDFSEPP